MKRMMMVVILALLTWVSLNSIAYSQWTWSEFDQIGQLDLDVFGYIENEYDGEYPLGDWLYLQVGVDATIFDSGMTQLATNSASNGYSAEVEIFYGGDWGSYYPLRVRFWVFPDVWWQLYETDSCSITLPDSVSESSAYDHDLLYDILGGYFVVTVTDDQHPTWFPGGTFTEGLSGLQDSCHDLDPAYSIDVHANSATVPGGMNPTYGDSIGSPRDWVIYYNGILGLDESCGWSLTQTVQVQMSGQSYPYQYESHQAGSTVTGGGTMGCYVGTWRSTAGGTFYWGCDGLNARPELNANAGVGRSENEK